MNRHEAKLMMENLLECQRDLDRALTLAEQLHIDHERDALVLVLKNVIGDILTEAIMPIASQHPDLDPYKTSDND